MYLAKHTYESLMAISEETIEIPEFKLLPFNSMKLNLKINFDLIYNIDTPSNGSYPYDKAIFCGNSSVYF